MGIRIGGWGQPAVPKAALQPGNRFLSCARTHARGIFNYNHLKKKILVWRCPSQMGFEVFDFKKPKTFFIKTLWV